MTSIRKAAEADLAAMQAIDDALGQRRVSLEPVRRALEDNRVIVAKDNDEIVGYLWWSWFWDKWPMSTLLRVHPEHQRRGWGSGLYGMAESLLRSLGCTFWFSSTEEDNEQSRLFHKALGFREIGSLAGLDQPVREVFMRKDLA